MMRNYALWALCLAITLLFSGNLLAHRVNLDVAVGHPVLLANQSHKTYLKVGLTGAVIEQARTRAPVNVAIVLDRSGSMSGEKIKHAREAAIMAIDRLNYSDIVSVIAYDSQVQVVVPATRVSDRESIYAAIRRLGPGGTTALFAGVSKGAQEVRKFISRNQVNRVILLSDGLANVGPRSPHALGSLGASLIKEGISVTTIGLGLGYNEDLMYELARRSDGNHAFVEGPGDLARIFNYEFGDLLSVAARDVQVSIECTNGVLPLRILGRDADITGTTIRTRLNQIYSKQEKYLLLELEVPPNSHGQTLEIARINVSYFDMLTKSVNELSSATGISFSESAADVAAHTNSPVMIAVVEQIATLENKRALALRDQGRLEDARKVLEMNTSYLDNNASRYQSKKLKNLKKDNFDDSRNLNEREWKKQRKTMRKRQFRDEMQQYW